MDEYILLSKEDAQPYLAIKNKPDGTVYEYKHSYFINKEWLNQINFFLDAENDTSCIKLYSRYPNVVSTLSQVDDNTYIFKTNAYYCRQIHDGDEILAIDPEGGPFIEVGNKIGGKTLKKILNTNNSITLILE